MTDDRFYKTEVDRDHDCILCGKETAYERVPSGWICFTCDYRKDATSEEILNALPVPIVPDIGPETELECIDCGYRYTLWEAHEDHQDFVRVVHEETRFDGIDAFVIARCPHCSWVAEYPTIGSRAEMIAEEMQFTNLGRGR